MALKTLPQGFNFSMTGAPAGGGGVGYGRNLVAATDQIAEYAAAEELKKKEFANNEAIAKAMQSGSSLAEIQGANPELFASLGPNVDAATIWELQKERAAAASTFDVNRSGINLNKTSADFNIARTAEVAPNALSTRQTQEAQRRQSNAATRLSNLTTTELEDAIEYDKGVAKKVTAFNRFYAPGGDLDKEIAAEFDATRDNPDWSDTQRALAKDTWTRRERKLREDQPDFMLNAAGRFGIEPRDFTGFDRKGKAYSEYGQQLVMGNQAAADREAAQATLDHEAAQLHQKGLQDWVDGDPESVQYTGTGISYGKSVSTIPQGEAITWASNHGFNVGNKKPADDNPNHVKAIKTLRDTLPDRKSFEYWAEKLKTQDGQIADNFPVMIEQIRSDLEGAAAADLAKYSQTYDTGQSADDVLTQVMSAYGSRTQTPVINTEVSAVEAELKSSLKAASKDVEIHPNRDVTETDRALIETLLQQVESGKMVLPNGNSIALNVAEKKRAERDLRELLNELKLDPARSVSNIPAGLYDPRTISGHR